MKTIIHISDLHFGSENKTMIEILSEKINDLSADLVVISGDFTQRAKNCQFKEAQQFLDVIRTKKLLVPGNHDIPLYNVFKRIMQPYERYKKYISPSLEMTYHDEELAILALNSTTPFRLKNGQISEEQFSKIATFFAEKPDAIKIVVMHHNLIHIKKFHHPIANHKEVISKLLDCKVNMVLSGHLHFPYLEMLSNKQSRLFLITAGTATSTRLREGDNSFNLIKVDTQGFSLDVFHFSQKAFNITETRQFTFSL